MKIKWIKLRGFNAELWIDGIDMGWVDANGDGHYRVLCMWMTEPDDRRVIAGELIASDYPEEHDFATLDEAKQALLDAATVMRIGGWEGRA